jgi:hypothetical protein
MVFFASPAMPEVIGDRINRQVCIFSRIQIILIQILLFGVWTVELTSFIGRKRELDQLQEEWLEKKAALLILYGRRRIGKTRLLTHWIETSGARVLYWVANPTSSLDQLRSFSQALYNFAGSGTVSEEFTFGTGLMPSCK